jgi:hypothetical protein
MKFGSHISYSQECRKLWRNEPPHSQVSSHFGSWSPDGVPNLQREISRAKNHWIEKFFISLESFWMYMSKMGLHDMFGYLKYKLWPKEGSEVKLPIWLSTTKSWDSPWFICVKVAYFISIEGLQKKLWASKVARVPILGISGLPTWEPRDKMTFGCWPCGQAQRIL